MSQELELLIRERVAPKFAFQELEIEVQGNKAMLVMSAPELAGLSPVKQQQAVYACVQDLLADGRLHALSMRLTAVEE